MKSTLEKKRFLRALEISLLFLVALFFMANSIQAQTSNSFNFPYNYDNFFTNSNSWFSFPSFDYQNNYRYGQSNWGGWPQSNISTFSSLSATPNYFSYNQPAYGLDYAPSTRTSSNNQQYSFASLGPGPSISSITFDSVAQTYNVPWMQYKTSFSPGAWIGTPDGSGNPWNVFLFQDMPVAYSNGTIKTSEGTSQAETITIEDDGDSFTFSPGEIFRIVLPMYDDISNEDFPYLAGWREENGYGFGHSELMVENVYVYGFESKLIGLEEDEDDELIQDHTYRGLWASPNAITLDFYYYRDDSDEIVDTFSVTIRIQGSGHYEPSY